MPDQPVTARQLHIIAGAARGDSRQEIAVRLNLTVGVVQDEFKNLGVALGVRSSQPAIVGELYRRGVLTKLPAEDRVFHKLTRRRKEVLELIAQGLTNEEVARELVLVLDTVKRHVGEILLDLGARNRQHAVALGFQLGHLRRSYADLHRDCERLPCEGCDTPVHACELLGRLIDAPVLCESCHTVPDDRAEYRAYTYC